MHKAGTYVYLILVVLFLTSCAVSKKAQIIEQSPLKIENVKITPDNFNPASGKKVNISYQLSKDAKITLNIYDPDMGFITALATDKLRKKGANVEVWDGRDFEGSVVPDQAYFFTIEAEDELRQKAVYDPTTFSGGEEVDIVDVISDRDAGTIVFNLPFSAWVLARLGIKNGALMKTLLDWQPCPKGENIVFWNGKDENNLIALKDHPKFSMMITTMSFPENSIITRGNSLRCYDEYKRRIANTRPEKTERPFTPANANIKLSRHKGQPRWQDRTPRFTIAFPEITETTPEGYPIIKEKALLKVILDERDKAYITGQRFEIVLYVDHMLYMEEEEGYTPFTWMWDVCNLSEGEHLLTINIVSLNDQVGAQSLKFVVKNR
ncbi:MAG: hypothetical protein ABH952_10010 [Candidatus Omnitrophota bacterium]